MPVYRVEFRVDVEADSPEDAERIARERVAEDGEITAVFDEDFEEV
jgi:hypothetical protein